MLLLSAAAVLLSLAAAPDVPVFTEPKTGISFPTRVDDMSLLGVGLRTKTFLKFKVYTLALYVADSALSGPLAVHRGKIGTAAFYHDIVVGDFDKQFVLKLARDLSAEQIQGGFRTHLAAADPKLAEQLLSYFGSMKAGGDCVLRWVPGVALETTVGGVAKPPIADKRFADEVFSIWLRDRPGEDAIRRQVVSRADELIR